MAKELNDFCDAVRSCIAAIDAEMGKPSDVERGKRIAKITNHLDLSLQIFERYHKSQYKKSRRGAVPDSTGNPDSENTKTPELGEASR